MAELNKKEKAFIFKMKNEDPVKIASKLRKGIGPRTVEKFIAELNQKGQYIYGVDPASEKEERKIKGKQIGDYIIKDHGATMMTETASSMSDARDTLAVQKANEKQKQRMTDKIHRPFKEESWDG